MFVVLGGGIGIGIGWGLSTAIGAGETWLQRAVGVAAMAGGLLLWVSYALYYHPGPLASAHWQGSPARRLVVLLFRYLWLAVLLVAGIGSIISRVTGAK